MKNLYNCKIVYIEVLKMLQSQTGKSPGTQNAAVLLLFSNNNKGDTTFLFLTM